MSKFEDKIMKKIKKEEIKPLSKRYFQLMKALFEVALIALILIVVFIFNLTFYLPRKGMGTGPRPERLNMLISSIPWLYLIIGFLGIALIIWLIYRNTAAYKLKPLIVIAVISFIILVTGFILSVSTINERAEKHREFRRFYNQEEMPRPFGPGMGPGRFRN